MTSQQWCNPWTTVTFQMPRGGQLSILVTTRECRKPTFFLKTLLGYAFTSFPFEASLLHPFVPNVLYYMSGTVLGTTNERMDERERMGGREEGR